MKSNVLVTAISGDVGNSILKCLQRDSDNLNLYGCDIYELPCGINKVSEFFQVVPCKNSKTYIEQLLDICKKCKIDIIIPTNEQEIQVIQQNRDIFEGKGIKLLIHDNSTYQIFFNKYETMEFLKKLGVDVPKTYYSDEYNNDLDFPVILKDVFSNGSKTVYIVDNDEKMQEYNAHSHAQIVQEYISDETKEYTVPIFAYEDGNQVYVFPCRRRLSSAGYTNYIESVDDKALDVISDIANKVAKAIRLNGCIDLQMRRQGDSFYVFECNPRLSGTVNFRAQLGFNDAVWWTHLVAGDNSKIVFEYPAGKFRGVRELNEVVVNE